MKIVDFGFQCFEKAFFAAVRSGGILPSKVDYNTISKLKRNLNEEMADACKPQREAF